MNAEKIRLEEDKRGEKSWKKWGPYLTERQWGTVREDYSPQGTAWEYVSHDAARSKAFRWGEEGIAGFCDDKQTICFSLALWNGHDSILKERFFGLTGNEGNHGEDVKEYYYYLDNTPVHSYMKMLYKYPQKEFPYTGLVNENQRRGKHDPEYELIDTGIFDENRYFDVFIEYAKVSPEDILIRLRFSGHALSNPFKKFNKMFQQSIEEADEFYADLQSEIKEEDARNVQHQAFAGMLWSKQFYYFDVNRWLTGDSGQPPPPRERLDGRNHEWVHLHNADIISMPDTWEFPWYATWDLAFHCLSLVMVDPEFAKGQLLLLTREWYMHPNGQLPAYEWAFGDVNPPVHAWATWRVYKIDKKLNKGKGDIDFLGRVFHKLLLNFTWWVNRKDEHGHNLFQGGFLGLDNIGVFDRSAALPTGGHIEQADGTSWMAMYCLNLMRIALELSTYNPIYQDMAIKFFEHFLYIAVETLEPHLLEQVPEFKKRLDWFLENRPDLASLISHWNEPGIGERRLLSLLRGHRMKHLLKRMLDESEFLSDYGIRALSRYHLEHPFVLHFNDNTFSVSYQPAESDSGLFGGNSNWRGPIWFPMNYLIIESLQKFHHYYGDDFKIECPTGSGNFMTINDVANELSRRLTRIFLQNKDGNRPVFGYNEKIQKDPHFRNYLLFHEYFHGDTGRGVGASHQTGWTGLVAKLLQPRDVGSF
ncbi:MAG: hypothetical protein NUV74_00080 [Candidatus Brocadiaceae bacterium]|nr:hypothetical protein [Candidatus Brocadiaceae bacterium]